MPIIRQRRPEGILDPLPPATVQPEVTELTEWSSELFDAFFTPQKVKPVVNDFWSQNALMDPELFGASK